MKLILAAFLVTVFALPSLALQIAKVKKDRVIIDIDSNDRIKRKTFLYVFDPRQNRVRGYITIKKVRGDRAIGRLDGKAKTGWVLMTERQYRRWKVTRKVPKHRKSLKLGFLAGYNMSDFTVNPDNGPSLDLSGQGLTITGFADLNMIRSFEIRTGVGLDNFNSSSADFCGVETCSTSIQYASIYGLVKYVLPFRQFKSWAGAGMSILSPLSKTSNAVDTSAVATTYVTLFSFGLDYTLSNKRTIPIQFEYARFPAQDGITASWLSMKAGYRFDF